MTDIQKKLVEDNLNLANHFVSKYCKSYKIEFEDKIQIARLGLCQAAIKFDPDMGFAFSTFAYRCMLNLFLMAARKHSIDPELLRSLDEPVFTNSTEMAQISLGDTIVSSIDVDQEVECTYQFEYALNRLNPKARKILEYILNNPSQTQAECANELGVSQSLISKAKRQFLQNYKQE